jgi:hypothetical protein
MPPETLSGISIAAISNRHHPKNPGNLPHISSLQNEAHELTGH